MRLLRISNTTIDVDNVVSIHPEVRSKKGSPLYSALIIVNGNIEIVIAKNVSHDTASVIASEKYEAVCDFWERTN